MDVYFVRHGESVYNVSPSNDIIDCSLTPKGIEQSIHLNHSLYPTHYSLIVCSPLRRCLDTINLSKLSCDQFEISDLFREIRSGCRSDLLNENEPVLIETEDDIEQRIQQINAYLLQKKQANIPNMLIVTHADLIWRLTSYKINEEYFGKWLNNAELMHWKRM